MKKAKAKIPGQSWSIKEKLDWSSPFARTTASLATGGYRRDDGPLFPQHANGGAASESGAGFGEAGTGRKKSLLATQSLRRFGYLTYDDSDGGCNHRNTYLLLKQSPKVEALTGRKNSLN